MAYLAKYLPEFGWDPVVVTRRQNGEDSWNNIVRTGRGSAIEGAAAFASRLPAQRLVSKLKEYLRQVIFFPDRASWWIPYAIAGGIDAHRRDGFDAIVSSAMPGSAHVVASTLSGLLGVPWVADYRDLWHGNPYVTEPAWRAKVLPALERRLLRRSKRITTITQTLAGELEALHSRQVSVIANTFDAD